MNRKTYFSPDLLFRRKIVFVAMFASLLCGMAGGAVFASTPSDATTPLKAGHHDKLPVTQRHSANAKAFLQLAGPRKVVKAYANPGFGPKHFAGDINKGSPESWIDYDNGSYMASVPDNYDGKTAFGIYLHISPSPRTSLPKGYAEILRKRKLIFVSPHGADNNRPYLERVARALDALASARSRLKIDDKRIIVGGLSGGGHIAFYTQMLFPGLFQGAISHAAQSYLPGHFHGFTLADCKQSARNRKWAVISGNKDYNYKEIQTTGAVWKKAGLSYRFFDVPGMGHTNAPPQNFDEALNWIEPLPHR